MFNIDFIGPELQYVGATFLAVFVIIDPFAVIPIYLAITEKSQESEKISIRRKSSLIAFGILILFAVTGMAIFNLFGITINAFRIAGGLLLLKFGMDQLSGNRSRVDDDEQTEAMGSDDVSVFPLATPLLAGPAAISTVVLYASKASSGWRVLSLILAVSLAMLASYILLKYAPLATRILGKTGLSVLTKIMGILLVAIAVQFILTGVQEFFGL